RFADKKLKFIKLKEQQLSDCNDVEIFLKNDVAKNSMLIKINEIERNIRTMKEIMNEKQSIINDMKKLLNKYERERFVYQKKQIDIKNKLNYCKNNLAKFNYNQNNIHRQKYSIQNELNLLIQKRLKQLTMFVFTIKENVFLSSTNNNNNNQQQLQHFDDDDDEIKLVGNDNDSEALPLLDCAIDDNDDDDNNSVANKTIKKKTESTTKLIRYKIVDSWIDLNENYEAGTHTNAIEYLDLGDNSFRDDHRRIMSALSYLCYLTNLFAFICRIHLPKKILFSELTCKRMKREQFQRKIARLNTNIMFLCCWYRVDIHNYELRPKQSIRNIKLALDVAINRQTNSDYNHLEIRQNIFRMIHNELLYDDDRIRIPKHKTIDNLATVMMIDDDTKNIGQDFEQDFDFIENNIPDLKFEDPSVEKPAGLLATLVSSIYKRTTTI
ncbi:autophagy protein 14, partial [Dermatophagoides pteronyssinus]